MQALCAGIAVRGQQAAVSGPGLTLRAARTPLPRGAPRGACVERNTVRASA